ncbi:MULTISPECIES: DUF4190 domain-containing protein [unclassified Modestobacter]|uniref:DUF4190 domain-containing protein n=1 Tax=unclassified Modestobacter TaxID=2643866 RepID=UPI0022AAC99A|nr:MULTISPECIES: DUF4190 domain-containing protein [unclassified Modestobacter]MCZ2811172.1 DUF4190 domain-containing protein [Modestobacter sp. VKM Ac-2979]MCZ2840685.1 DUF4190 domain-containing protein [Modestobacter sp. VKM Ac-2980]MCZ2847975.1 DUF4190 domain-containing protein [Modestobacter sp. VKM Ac-2978]
MHDTQTSTVHLDPENWPVRAVGTDAMAVLGLVFAFVFFPLGIVFSALGLRNTRRDGTRGRGLALAGMTISLLQVVAVVGLVLWAAFGAGS